MGAGAHSYFAERRFSHERNPATYIKRVKQGQLPEAQSKSVGHLQAMSETAFLALRTAMGLHLPTFAERFGVTFVHFVGERLDTVTKAGLLECADGWLRLSKRGRLLGNEVFLRLLPD